MKRKEFIKKSLAGSAVIAGFPASIIQGSPEIVKNHTLVNAYYFRAHMYTLVPDQVKYDMDRIASTGAGAVSLAILEQDLFAAVENVRIIKKEANQRGMKVFAVPSRWGGLLAGAPKVPSLFTIKNQQTWMLDENKKPYQSGVSGRISSIHYPETVEFFRDSLQKTFELWNLDGIVWDEPKNMMPDYSEAAMHNLEGSSGTKVHLEAVRDFYSEINAYIKTIKEDAIISMFLYANVDKLRLEIMSEIRSLDYFGCDGRPWYSHDDGQNEGDGKCLLDSGLRFLKQAEKTGKKSLWLVENHNLNQKDTRLLAQRLPEVLSHYPNQLIYYYFPRNLSNPEEIMTIMENQIKKHYVTIQ